MKGEQTANRQVSTLSKIAYGLLLPDAVFIAYQFILIGSISGTGSWDGMLIFYGSLFIVPGQLAANCWVIPFQWGRKDSVFLAGMMIPAVIGAIEFLWLYGPNKIRWTINSARSAPSFGTCLFVLLLFAPLLISIVYAIRRRLHGDKK
jgi:hypothetical protein